MAEEARNVALVAVGADAVALVGGADADADVGVGAEVDAGAGAGVDGDQVVGWDWLRFRGLVVQVASVGRWIATAAERRPVLRILWSGHRIGLD